MAELHGLYMGITKYLLTGMILQVPVVFVGAHDSTDEKGG